MIPPGERSDGVAAAPAAAEARRFLSYLAMGAVATAVHYAVLIALVESAQAPAWMASGAGAIVGAQVAYIGNRWFTFSHRGALALSWRRFQLTALLGAGVSMLVVALAVRWGLHYLIGQVVATGVAVVLTYAINRRWTFAARPDPT